jgi:two-component system sensor histidine kinase VicK
LPFSLSSLPITWRNIETDSTTKSTIVIIDEKESLVIEIKDNTKDTFSKSVGFATYSNSNATVLSYVSIFESFWKQSDLVKKLKESEELQKDFVHIAAHELKNPIQPILASSTILNSKIKDKESCEILEVINRKAKKLNQLTNDVLDVTKIETNNFNLNKELFDLNEVISNIIADFKNQFNNKNVTLSYKISTKEDKFGTTINGKGEEDNTDDTINVLSSSLISADNNRITQVIMNLLNNAIKFTQQGKIVIEATKIESD